MITLIKTKQDNMAFKLKSPLHKANVQTVAGIEFQRRATPDGSQRVQGMESSIINPTANGEQELKTEPKGNKEIDDLVKKADVVIDNFRPGVLKRLKINYEVLSEINKRIIQCSVTGYGEKGEYANLPALDIIIQSITGYMAITGEPDSAPVRTGIPLADLSGGIFSCKAILAALYKREKTGQGSSINLSMFDGMLNLLTYLGTVWLTKGELPVPPGSSHMYSVPWQAFKVSDGYVVIATRQEVFWERMCNPFPKYSIRKYSFDQDIPTFGVKKLKRALSPTIFEVPSLVELRFSIE